VDTSGHSGVLSTLFLAISDRMVCGKPANSENRRALCWVLTRLSTAQIALLNQRRLAPLTAPVPRALQSALRDVMGSHVIL
jgi:hypothetical protein